MCNRKTENTKYKTDIGYWIFSKGKKSASANIQHRYTSFNYRFLPIAFCLFFFIVYCLLPIPYLYAQDFQSLKSQFEVGQPDKRKEAVEIVSRIKSQESFHLLTAAIKDSDSSVREAALRGISLWPREQFLSVIFPLLDDPDISIKNSVKKIILSKPDEKTFELLKDFLKTARNETNLTFETIDVMSDFSPDIFIPYLSSISKENDNIRYALSRILHKFKNDSESLNILKKYLKDEIPEIRLEAAQSISKVRHYPYIEKLLPLLLDKDEKIKKHIPQILKSMASRDSLIYWIESLRSDSPHIRNFCVETICEISEPQALPIVFSMLDDPSDNVRKTAFTQIHKLYHTSLNYFLISELKSKNPLKRKTAIELLKLSKSHEIVPTIFHILEKEKNKEVACAAIQTLTMICTSKNFYTLKDYLNSHNSTVRIAAIKCLTKISSTIHNDVVKILSEYATKEKNPAVQKELLNSLKDIKPTPSDIIFGWTVNQPVEIKLLTVEFLSHYSDANALPSLINAAQDKNSEVSLRAKEAIEKVVKTTSDAEALSEYLKLPQKHLQLFILNILKKFPSKIIAENLKTLKFEAADTEIKYAIIEVIRNAKLSELHPFLTIALKDKNSEVRWLASKTINEIPTAEVTAEILLALSDPSPSVREEALKTIAKNPSFVYVPKIIPLLSDTDTSVRYHALIAIEHTVTSDALKKIQTMLSDNDPGIRSLSAKIIGKSNVQDAAVQLRKMAESDLYPECRKAAAQALYQIGDLDEKTLEIYFSLVKDNDSSVREAARNILNSILNKSHLQYILKALIDDNRYLRSYALDIILKLNLYEANPYLFNIVKSFKKEDKRETQRVLTVLSALIDENDLGELESLYTLNNPELKLWVIEQLKKLKSEGARNLLVRALREENPAFRQKAIESLSDLKEPRIRAALSYISDNDPDPLLRKLAKEKLKK